MLFLESYSCIKFNSISGCGQDATRVCDFIFLKTMCICKQACAALFSDSAYQFEYFSAMLLLSLQVNASGQFCGVAEDLGMRWESCSEAMELLGMYLRDSNLTVWCADSGQ
jgi:hypothetical protein